MRDREGRTPLLYAPTREIAELLLEAGADVTIRDEKGRGLLHYGAAKGSLELVSLALERGIEVDAVDRYKRTAMHYAFACADEEMISFLKDKGANIDARDKKDGTPLHLSLFFYPAHKKLILNQGSDTNMVNSKGETLLHTACQVSDDCIRYLLDNTKININAINLARQTAVHYAVKGGYMTGAVAIIMRKDYKGYAARDSKGRTVLHDAGLLSLSAIAAARGYSDPSIDSALSIGITQRNIEQMYRLLIRFFSNKIKDCVNIQDNEGKTILHDAVRAGRIERVKFLLNTEGVDINAKDCDDRTALHDAVIENSPTIVGLLLEKEEFDINAQDCYGQTALHYAAKEDREEIAYLLSVASEVDLNIQDNEGKTPLHDAVENNRVLIVKYLLEARAELDIKDNGDEIAIEYSEDDEITRLLTEELAIRNPSQEDEDSSEDEDYISTYSSSP